jgi:superfamily II DNA or RNA helicase
MSEQKTTEKIEWKGRRWFLGLPEIKRWSNEQIVEFLKSIKPYLVDMDSDDDNITLLKLIQSEKINRLLNDSSFKSIMFDSLNTTEKIDKLDSIIDKYTNDATILSEDEESEQEEKANDTDIDELVSLLDVDIKESTSTDTTTTEEKGDVELAPKVTTLGDIFKYVDSDFISNSADDELVQFIINKRYNKIWNEYLSGNVQLVEDIKNMTTEVIDKHNYGKNCVAIRSLFLNEYEQVINLPTPNGFKYKLDGETEVVKPNLMQKLICHRVSEHKRYGNWSGTGAGKTLSAVLASKHINAKVTVIVAANATIHNWKTNIKESFDDVNIITVPKQENLIIHDDKTNYIILNYEKFQDDRIVNFINILVNKHVIDFIVLDEVQFVKSRLNNKGKSDEKLNISKRRQMVTAMLSEARIKCESVEKELYVLSMSATPVINDLQEAKGLLELTKGVKYDELETQANLRNCLDMHVKLINNGLRYKPDYKSHLVDHIIDVDGNDVIDDLIKIERKKTKSTALNIEQILIGLKLDAIEQKGLLTRGTLIYIDYIKGIRSVIEEKLDGVTIYDEKLKRNRPIRYVFYTGKEDIHEREAILDDAKDKNGKYDIIIGSKPIGTGVDGLQHRFDKLVFLLPPWTAAEYLQIIGRVHRQGSKFDKVYVYRIHVTIKGQSYGDWSYDKNYKYKIIDFKRTIADITVDGKIPTTTKLPNRQELAAKALDELEKTIKRIESNGRYMMVREYLQANLPDVELKVSKRISKFGEINKSWNKSTSKNLHTEIKKNPSVWKDYHKMYTESRKRWKKEGVAIPYEKYADYINVIGSNNNWTIADFGCGEDHMRTLIDTNRHTLISLDHYAANDDVMVCDMANTPLDDESVDHVFFSLSLMGSNYKDYLREAFRVLKKTGYVSIAENEGKWDEERIMEFKDYVENEVGFKWDMQMNDKLYKRSGYFIYMNLRKVPNYTF